MKSKHIQSEGKVGIAEGKGDGRKVLLPTHDTFPFYIHKSFRGVIDTFSVY